MPDGFDGYEKDRDAVPVEGGLRVIDPGAVRRKRRGQGATAEGAGPRKAPRLKLVPPAVSNGAVATPFSDGADLVDLEDLPRPCRD